jgi:AcrR family transcriptional regulator
MEGVAERAGVGKATVYRRWRSKVALVADAATEAVQEVGLPDTGSVRADVTELLRAVVRVLTGSLAGRVLPWLVAEQIEQPELREAMDRFWAARRSLMLTVLERGIARGELRRDLDPELTADLLYGPIHYRYLVSGAPLSADYPERLADLVLEAVTIRDGSRGGRERR